MPKNFSKNVNFLKVAYDHLGEGIIVVDEKGCTTYLNSSAKALLQLKNLPSENPTFLDVVNFSTALEKNRVRKFLETKSPKQKTTSFSLSLKKYPNQKREVTIDFTSIGDTPDVFHGYIIQLSEATKKDALFKSIKESEKKYRGLFEHAQEGIFVIDDRGKIVDYNSSACEVYNRDDFFNTSIFDLFPHNKNSDNKSLWKGFMDSGKINGFYKFITPKGNVKYIDFRAKSNFLPNLHLAVLTDQTDIHTTANALLKADENLKVIFDNSDHSIILIDTSMKILAYNSNARNNVSSILGKSLRNGEPLLSYVINKELFLLEFSQAIKGEKVVVERNITGIHGEDNWIEFSYVPIKNTKGIVVNICYTSLAINNRKKEALILKDSEEKFRSLSENSPDIIYIIDLQIRAVTYFNRDDVLGYSSDQLKSSEEWIEIVSPEDYKRVIDYWQSFLKSKSKKAGSIEYRIRNKTGTYEWVSNRHTVIEWNMKGAPKKVLLTITIITDRINAQEALKESENRLKALIENTSDLVWSVDNELTLTAINAAFSSLIFTNYKKKLSLGNNLISSLPFIQQDGWLALHITALKGKKVTAEFSWKNKKKENLYYEISYNPIYDVYNNISGVSVFARDITQRKNNEATIVQTNFELDSFVYRASHDLRAPLRSILGLVNIINSETGALEKASYLTLIEKSAKKLDNFISDLINFSRNSRATVDIEEVDFASIIAECRENLGYMEGANNVAFTTKIKGESVFYSDPKRISIFFSNLLSNAIKYKDNNGKRKSFLSIQITISKKKALIKIQDNGVGIKKEYQSKIFNMFFRASESSYGSGLGLYIARQAIERLGGEIMVDSKLGVGTTFIISLPDLEDKMFDITSM